MNSSRWSVLLWLVMGSSALAQADPHIGYVYPAGGRQGTTFQAAIGGQSLNNAAAISVSGTGVSATILKQERQVTPTEQKELREVLNQIQEKRKQGQRVTPEEAKRAEEIKQKLTNFGRRLTNPSLGDFITVRVAIAPTAATGNRELRLLTPAGLSNPLVFNVGELPEFSKKDWKDIPKAKFSMDPELDPRPPEKDITLPSTLNGQIPPGGVDRYRFPAREGQQLVVVVRARELIPYISDAVPGWFQARVALSDAKGAELACADDFRFHLDPALAYKIPASGDYVLEVKDALYRGREDFIYRISVGELPFVTRVFPLGGRVGALTTVTVAGWNLPTNRLALDLRRQEPGTHPVSVGRLANPVPFRTDTLPEIFEQEPNNAPANAQPVTLPILINGRIDQPGDRDVFRFEGQAGEPIVAEVYARRLDSPLDSLLSLTDTAGKQLAFNDDYEDKGSGLNTHHADSYLAVTLPATGAYFLQIGDTQHGGGGAYGYRLRISAPRPDFALRVTPSSLNVRGGASVPLTVHALRQDGFTGAITLSLKDAPKGFTLAGAQIPEQQDQARFTLNAPPSAREPFNLHLEGRATVQGRELLRPAIPADDVMQSFSYRHLVTAQELKVAVIGRFRAGDAAQILSATPVRISAGGAARVRVRLPTGPLVSKVQFELSEPPDGISLKEASASELVFQADAAKAKPGLKGNLIVKASGERSPEAGDEQPPANRRRIPLGALPAIPFEIVPQ